jgi:hypothetical protein
MLRRRKLNVAYLPRPASLFATYVTREGGALRCGETWPSLRARGIAGYCAVVRLGTSESSSFTELVERARHGDEHAWRALVGRLERVVWKAVNMSTDDQQVRVDAAAATWLRLAENLQGIRDPERLPGWMVTTARREVIAHFRRNRLVPDDRMMVREARQLRATPPSESRRVTSARH